MKVIVYKQKEEKRGRGGGGAKEKCIDDHMAIRVQEGDVPPPTTHPSHVEYERKIYFFRRKLWTYGRESQEEYQFCH